MRLNLRFKMTFLIVAIVFIILAGIYFYLHTFLLTGQKLFSPHFHQSRGWILVVSLAISGVVGWFGSLLIVRPVREISDASKALVRGDFSSKLDIFSDDEIGDISRSLNDLSISIQSRISEVLSSRLRLEAVFFSMIEGVMIIDGHGSIMLMNQTLKDFLKVERDPQGLNPLEVIRNIEIHEMVDKVVRQQGGPQSRELKVFMPAERVLRVHATPVLREGVIDGAVMTFHDITDLRQLEKVRQDFVANVSHELRTPISTIKGYAETLLSGALDDKAHAREFLSIIYQDADRLAKLINDLLDLSKIESETMVLRPRPIFLRQAVQRVLDALKNQAGEKDIKIHVDLSKDLSPVFVDDNSLVQILLNLIENAIKYNHPKGNVFISARDQEATVEVKIADGGLGIPERDIRRIFERFYRVDKAHSRKIGGTGLGLSIVKHLIQSNGGSIRVESAVGHGTDVYITLPKKLEGEIQRNT